MIHMATIPIMNHALVPWSAPNVGKGYRKHNGESYGKHRKEPRLVRFQEYVNDCAKVIWGDKPKIEGPCYLEYTFSKLTYNRELWGTWCYVPLGGAKNIRGDVTNYIKAVEDGLEGVCFDADQLVCAGRQMIVWSDRDACCVKVYALGKYAPIADGVLCHPFLL